MIVECLRQLTPTWPDGNFKYLTKDLLRECFSYLDNSIDILRAGRVCKECYLSLIILLVGEDVQK